MKVLNLCCADQHRFEGWFASEKDFQTQMEAALVACPICDSKSIVRLPSAPRLNVSRQSAPGSEARKTAADEGRPGADTDVQARARAQSHAQLQTQAQGQWLQAMRQVLKNTEDVGNRFPEEARRIHYGETKERGIRGQATPEDAQALRDEGIEVVSVALPGALKGPVQ